jgi:hypothetical protein
MKRFLGGCCDLCATPGETRRNTSFAFARRVRQQEYSSLAKGVRDPMISVNRVHPISIKLKRFAPATPPALETRADDSS